MVFVDDFVIWEKKLALRRSVVLFVTLWMSYRAFDWATQYAAATLTVDINGLKAATTIAAVTFPITYLQKVVFEEYIKSK